MARRSTATGIGSNPSTCRPGSYPASRAASASNRTGHPLPPADVSYATSQESPKRNSISGSMRPWFSRSCRFMPVSRPACFFALVFRIRLCDLRFPFRADAGTQIRAQHGERQLELVVVPHAWILTAVGGALPCPQPEQVSATFGEVGTVQRDLEVTAVPQRPRRALCQCLAVTRADRKSTRLNSSHMSISYAV